METFHLFHLASCWVAPPRHLEHDTASGTTPPPISEPTEVETVDATLSLATTNSVTLQPRLHEALPDPNVNGKSAFEPSSRRQPCIRAASVQMIFAERSSRAFITPEQVQILETACATGLLEALIAVDISPEVGSSTRSRPTNTDPCDLSSSCIRKRAASGRFETLSVA